MRRFVLPLFALLAMSGLALAAEVKSGQDIGSGVAPFNVKDITGPSAGKSLCYRCQYGAKPVAAVFIRDVTPEVATLIQKIDAQVGENKDKKMCAFVVLLTDDADAGAKKLKELAADKGIKNVPLTVFDGVAGPDSYKIAKDAAVTVMTWNKSKVQTTHGFGTAKLSDEEVKTAAASTAKVVG